MAQHNSANDDRTVEEHVTRTDVGVSIETKIKRGEGTRDQDTIKAKVKAESLDEARDMQAAVIGDLHEWADAARAIQPGDDEDE